MTTNLVTVDANWLAGGAMFSRPEAPDTAPAYRYNLERWWGPPSSFVLWVMLNPSTGTAIEDDRTIRRVIQRTKLHFPDATGLRIVNMFAWRASRPSELCARDFDDAVGNPHNDASIGSLSAAALATIAGWGASKDVSRQWLDGRQRDMARLLVEPLCLGLTDGRPRHPAPRIESQLPLDVEPVPWRPH